MKVKEIMHSNVTWVAPDTTLSKIAKKMRDEDIGAVPVGENDRLIGMVTDRDITCRAAANGGDMKKLTARKVMTKNVVWCRDTDDVKAAARLMESKKIRRLPVIDENKRMVGMLSLGDFSGQTPKSLSGEIASAVAAHHA